MLEYIIGVISGAVAWMMVMKGMTVWSGRLEREASEIEKEFRRARLMASAQSLREHLREYMAREIQSQRWSPSIAHDAQQIFDTVVLDFFAGQAIGGASTDVVVQKFAVIDKQLSRQTEKQLLLSPERETAAGSSTEEPGVSSEDGQPSVIECFHCGETFDVMPKPDPVRPAPIDEILREEYGD